LTALAPDHKSAGYLRIKVQRQRTVELAHNSNPPMGANMMPTAKKMGRTVFGVRMGLRRVNFEPRRARLRATYCHAFNLCCRKAVSGRGQQDPEGAMGSVDGLAGLLLFCFLGGSLWGSSAVIESVCTMVGDILVIVSCVQAQALLGAEEVHWDAGCYAGLQYSTPAAHLSQHPHAGLCRTFPLRASWH